MRRISSGRMFGTVLVIAAPWATLLASAQTGDVRIDISSGSGKRIPILCESFQGGGDRTARESSVIADTVLANDLANSGVFDVTRSWIGVAAGTEQAVVGGKWIVNGNQLRLEGEVHDLPARRAIFSKEYRGSLPERRRLAHRRSGRGGHAVPPGRCPAPDDPHRVLRAGRPQQGIVRDGLGRSGPAAAHP